MHRSLVRSFPGFTFVRQNQFQFIRTSILMALVAVFFVGCDKAKEMADNASDAFSKTKEKIQDRVNNRGTKETSDDDGKQDLADGGPITPQNGGKKDPPKKLTPAQKWEEFNRIASNNIKDEDIKTLADDPEAAKLVTELTLTSARITVNALNELAKFPNLTRLLVNRVQCVPSGINYLSRLTKLEALDVSENQINDNQLQQLASLKSLKELNLSKTRISDAGFVVFQSLPQIEVLIVNECQIDGSGCKFIAKDSLKTLSAKRTKLGMFGFESLGGAKQLEILDLSFAFVSDKTMVGIGRCPKLLDLRLASNDITNDGLKRIQRHKRLEEVYLYGNSRISNPGLGTLSTIKTLKHVSVMKTGCSPDLKEEFLKRVPGCQIEF